MRKYLSLLMREYVICTVGAFGTVTAFFSSAFPLMSWAYGLVAGIFTLILCELYRGKNTYFSLLLPGLLIVLAAFLHHTGFQSLVSLWNSMTPALEKPYALDLALTQPPREVTSSLPALIWCLLMTSSVFSGASLSGFFRIFSVLLSIPLCLMGFYFGSAPAGLALSIAAAYWLSRIFSLPGKDSPAQQGAVFTSTLLAGCLLSILVPSSYTEPDILSATAQEIISLTDPYDPIFHAGTAFSSVTSGVNGKNKLGETDSVHYTGQVIAQIASEDISSRLYIRSFTAGKYKDNQWSTLPASDYKEIEPLFTHNQGEWYDQGAWLMEVMGHSEDLSSALYAYDPRAVDFKNFRRVFRVTSVYIQTPYYFIPYDLDISFNGFVFDWAPQGTGPKAYNSYIMDMPSGAMITFLRTNHSSDPYLLTYENGESAYRRFVYSHYLDIPEALRSRIRTLLPVPHARTYEEKRAWYHTVSQFLQNNYRYTTHPGRTAAGEDFISDFLFNKKEGYCTAFASAGVMLLRAGGVPARYVTGLTVSTDEVNNADIANGFHTLDINDHHAHAWAEVYVDDIGWRPAELTPGYDGAADPFPAPADEKQSPDQPDKQSPDNQSGQQNEQQQPQNAAPEEPIHPLPSPSVLSSFLMPLLMIVVLLTLAAGALFFIIRQRREFAGNLFAEALRNPSQKTLRQLVSYLHRLLLWAGLPGITTTYEEWTSQVARDKRFASATELMPLLLKLRYSGQKISPEDMRHVVDILSSMRSHCLSPLRRKERWLFYLKKL